jgi:hypothetical protein
MKADSWIANGFSLEATHHLESTDIASFSILMYLFWPDSAHEAEGGAKACKRSKNQLSPLSSDSNAGFGILGDEGSGLTVEICDPNTLEAVEAPNCLFEFGFVFSAPQDAGGGFKSAVGVEAGETCGGC